MATNKIQATPNVFVNAYARLHMGFLDLNGQAGRRFGSLGLGLDAPDTLIELALGKRIFNAAEANYVLKSKQALLAYANIKQEVSIHVHREIPRHFGLGSGTQMALAVGAGISQLFDLNLTLDEIANITGRGNRSGIGIGTFSTGGLVIDGGRSAKTITPPIIAQHSFPSDWRVLLIFDQGYVGIHGEEELKAFAHLEDADLQLTQQVCHQVMMQALPAIKEQDLHTFGEAVALLQAYTGDYFSPVQGGRFTSQLVAQVLNFLTEDGVLCVGQSSWGPTGFAIFESEKVAEQYLTRLQSTFTHPSLSWLVCAASNAAASILFGK
ncbi:MAG: beta-ribofuranosylaminobenzene 5'-phosphate synthase family protein [Methylophilaceae bacterium]